MATIRVSPSRLRESAKKLENTSAVIEEALSQLQLTVNKAPSYEGQFGPKVQALGAEATTRAHKCSNALSDLSDGLQVKADAFEAADRVGAEGISNLELQVQLPIVGIPWLDILGIPDWVWELIIGFLPLGDSYDIMKQLANSLKGEDVDKLVLVLAIFGLIADLGWLQPIPSVEDAPNAVLAFLKTAVKQIPPGPARDALAEIAEQAIKNPDEFKRLAEVVETLTKHEDLVQAIAKNPDALVVLLKNSPEVIELIAKYGDDGAALINRFGQNGVELLMRHGGDLPASRVETLVNLPIQNHHILTNKHTTRWTDAFTEITQDYGLSLNDAWNKIDIPHMGSHADEYHEWVYEQLVNIDLIAEGDKAKFLELFDELIRAPLEENPLIIRREWYP